MTQISLAQIDNIHGYNEHGAAFLRGSVVDVRRIEKNGIEGYVVALYDSWIFVIGKPTQNPFWFKSDDSAVRLLLMRRTDCTLSVNVDQAVEYFIANNQNAFDIVQLKGHVSVEAKGGVFEMYLNVKSTESVSRNGAWLKSLEINGDTLSSNRMRTLPGELSPVVIKGPITSVKIFTGW